MQIVYIDDHSHNHRLVGRMLKRLQHTLAAFTDAKTALAHLEEAETVDLLLLDLMMPKMNGYEVIERLRATPRYATLPIIVISASFSSKSRHQALVAGATAFIHKPINADELRHLVGKYASSGSDEAAISG